MTRAWTDDELIDVLHAAALECGEPLRVKAYRAWAAEREDRPGSDVVVAALGPWAEALDAAGLVVREGRRRHR